MQMRNKLSRDEIANAFHPCNDREAGILARLKDNVLERYKQLRHKGATVTEALDQVEPPVGKTHSQVTQERWEEIGTE